VGSLSIGDGTRDGLRTGCRAGLCQILWRLGCVNCNPLVGPCSGDLGLSLIVSHLHHFLLAELPSREIGVPLKEGGR
jgi:hypothetical protein